MDHIEQKARKAVDKWHDLGQQGSWPSYEYDHKFDELPKVVAEFGRELIEEQLLKNQTSEYWQKKIRGALKSSLDAHGIITENDIESAAKRIYGELFKNV